MQTLWLHEQKNQGTAWCLFEIFCWLVTEFNKLA